MVGVMPVVSTHRSVHGGAKSPAPHTLPSCTDRRNRSAHRVRWGGLGLLVEGEVVAGTGIP